MADYTQHYYECKDLFIELEFLCAVIIVVHALFFTHFAKRLIFVEYWPVHIVLLCEHNFK